MNRSLEYVLPVEVNKLTILDQKLQELIDRFPQLLDRTIFKERDRLIAYFDHDFTQKRSADHLFRLLSSQYFKKKKLLSLVSLSPKTRYLSLRILPTQLEFPFGSKWVVGILVQIYLNRYELFDQEQLLKAVQKFLPDLKIVKGSIYTFQGAEDRIKTLYVEFEKNSSQYFTLSEIKKLKLGLEEELLSRIERVVPAVFMTRNQEEVLRNILTLSQEIDQSTDLPQIMISFDMQTAEDFVFTAICVRVENHETASVDNLIKQRSSFSQFILERKQLVKYLKDHQPIFAYIFKILLTPHPTILRSDGSLNFFAARQKIGNYLKENIGEFRDFNGGILIKQEETLHTLKNALPGLSPELIENVFYSITPIEMQAILPLPILKTMLQLFLHISELPLLDSFQYILKSSRKDHLFIVMLRIPHGPFYEIAKDHLLSFDLPEVKKASIALTLNDSYLVGYLLETETSHLQNLFIESLDKLLIYWRDEVKKTQVLRLGLENPVSSLDPRIGGDGVSALVLKMLFEGLMRISSKGSLENGIAHEVEISEDRKTYLFRLRPTVWSNGEPLTSYDFEYAWKKIVSPRFNTAFAYLFYIIKNAEAVKKGAAAMNQLGIHALDDLTLKIELESPSLNFLEYLAHPLFSPVCRQIDINEPNWPFEEGNHYVCNGPFKIEYNQRDSSYVFVKNPHYWEISRIHLDRILITASHHSQTEEMFYQNKIQWLGAPLGAWNNSYTPTEDDEVMVHPDHGLYWCVCNTRHPILKNNKIRKALALAIDRLQLLENLKYPKKPAYSPLPTSHCQTPNPSLFKTGNAQKLLSEGLEELGIPLSSLNIGFTQRTVFGKAAAEFLSSEWEKKLGISTTIQGYDYKTIFSKLTTGDFQIALIRWQPWVNDPFYTLNFFANPEEPMNFSKWSHPDLQALLHEAQLETEKGKQIELLIRIEQILIDEMPIIPLFETCLQFMKKKYLLLEPNHTLIDFKWARFQ